MTVSTIYSASVTNGGTLLAIGSVRPTCMYHMHSSNFTGRRISPRSLLMSRCSASKIETQTAMHLSSARCLHAWCRDHGSGSPPLRDMNLTLGSGVPTTCRNDHGPGSPPLRDVNVTLGSGVPPPCRNDHGPGSPPLHDINVTLGSGVPTNPTRALPLQADKTVSIWDMTTGAHVITLKGHTSHVTGVCWVPRSNNRLMSCE